MATIEEILGDEATALATLKVVADGSFDSILVTDATPAGKIVFANRAFEKLTGHKRGDVLGQTPRILQGTGTDSKVIDRLRKCLGSGKSFEGKAINYKKDGTPFIMFWRVLPVKVKGRIRFWVAIQREGASI
ncbi:MAG: PAS domain-containing protein [Deltaproteobacteria bacterium]|jgi:PAS domain S-box-containing protein